MLIFTPKNGEQICFSNDYMGLLCCWHLGKGLLKTFPILIVPSYTLLLSSCQTALFAHFHLLLFWFKSTFTTSYTQLSVIIECGWGGGRRRPTIQMMNSVSVGRINICESKPLKLNMLVFTLDVEEKFSSNAWRNAHLLPFNSSSKGLIVFLTPQQLFVALRGVLVVLVIHSSWRHLPRLLCARQPRLNVLMCECENI